MQQVIVTAFGGVETLQVCSLKAAQPRPHEVVINLTSIGMNQADLMARKGEYRISSGEPPFTPGIEGGGVITAVGEAVSDRTVGQRVILSIQAPASIGAPEYKGTYRSQFVAPATETIPVPDGIDEALIGALWLPFLTAWGALVWQQNIQPGQIVMLPAASSSVAIAASQIVKQHGSITIGTTTSPTKVEALQRLNAAQYDHIVVTSNRSQPWWKTIRKIAKTQGQNNGIDIIFDPVAAGDFLHHEIRLLAQGGTLWVYGLLGSPGKVDVSPLIRKNATIRGWLLNHISGTSAEQEGYTHILENMAVGRYQMPIAAIFPLDQVQAAQTAMAQGKHIGKYILKP